jgi:rubrerythrin
MPELMTKKDAIEYLLYMKHDVQAKSPMDIALDTAIEALKQPTIEAAPVRNGRWIPTEYDGYADGYPVYDAFECSECGHEHNGEEDTLTAFCPDCGAKMDEEDEK